MRKRNLSRAGILGLCFYFCSAWAIGQPETAVKMIPVPPAIRAADWSTWFFADMNGDGSDELVYEQITNGASAGWNTCRWDGAAWVEMSETLPEKTVFAHLLPRRAGAKDAIVYIRNGEAGGYEYGVHYCGTPDKKEAPYPDNDGALRRGLAVYGHLEDEDTLNVVFARWTDHPALDAEVKPRDLEVYELTPDGPKLLAISQGHAGLTPVGIADLDDDGKAEIVALQYNTERQVMEMHIYHLQDGEINSDLEATFVFERETSEVRGVTLAWENGKFILFVVHWDFVRKLTLEYGKLVEAGHRIELPDGWRGFGAFSSDFHNDSAQELVVGAGKETSNTFEYAFLMFEQSTETATGSKP